MIKKPSKKMWLYIANVIAFILVVCIWCIFIGGPDIFVLTAVCIAIELLFLFGSIISYYLSIIANAMTNTANAQKISRKTNDKIQKS